jgi:hypothetical protein
MESNGVYLSWRVRTTSTSSTRRMKTGSHLVHHFSGFLRRGDLFMLPEFSTREATTVLDVPQVVRGIEFFRCQVSDPESCQNATVSLAKCMAPPSLRWLPTGYGLATVSTSNHVQT